MSRPHVSIILPVYNAALFLDAALQSLVRQTFADFELIAINDASTDASAAILAACADTRLRVLHNTENLGVAGTLNRGLQAARGAYIARMDADDIAFPERLARQVDYLDRHPDAVLLGTAFHPFQTGGKPQAAVLPETTDSLIRWYSCWYNRFAHPTVLFRRAALEQLALPVYDPALRVAEDYDLWTRLLACGTGANLPTPLLLYRIHADSASVRKAQHLADEHMRTARLFAAATLGDALPDPAQHRAIASLFLQPDTAAAADFPLRLYLTLAARYTATLPPSVAAGTYRQIHGEILFRLLRQGKLRQTLNPALLTALAAKCIQLVRWHPRWPGRVQAAAR